MAKKKKAVKRSKAGGKAKSVSARARTRKSSSAPTLMPSTTDLEPSFEKVREREDDDLEKNIFADEEEAAPEREEKEEEPS
jgi:hypothetical protein